MRLKHPADEKYAIIEKTDILDKKILQLQQKLSDQAQEHKSILKEERARQEQSENRWLNLIDQARAEAKNIRKNYEITINNKSKKIEAMQDSIVDYQHKTIAQQTTVEHHKSIITDLKDQLGKINDQYITANAFVAYYKHMITIFICKAKD